jgi:hypothetical protein
MVRTGVGSRQEHPDMLKGRPGDGSSEDRWAVLLIDPAAQMAELADLVARGLVSPADLERQRRKVFGG